MKWPCSEARFAPKDKDTNEVSAAFPRMREARPGECQNQRRAAWERKEESI
jgi:hypothetical protein